ncbi:MAG: hypothetical protein SGBAC_013284 [Bacillariaceae sp.]
MSFTGTLPDESGCSEFEQRIPSIPTPSKARRPSLTPPQKWRSFNAQERIIIALLLVIIMLFMQLPIDFGFLGIRSGSNPKTRFQGANFWNPDKTLEVKTLYETPFARSQIHKVKAGKNTIIDDWLWCDEMDHINVLVQEAKTGMFVIFRQTKYGIPGPPTLAVVGGMIEPGETPLESARRELMEELQMESNDWISMGHYRAAVNRGGGYTHTFLAKNAVLLGAHNNKNKEVIGQADYERQDIVRCTQEELLQYVLDGKFGEIKWTATVALSLLRLRS